MSKATYAGSIKNTGAQVVKAPLANEGKSGNTVKVKGGDLRSK